jgi:cell division protein FtsL
MSKILSNLKTLFDPKKLGLILVAVILLFLVMDLNSRLNELARLTTQRDEAATIVANLESTLQVLQTKQAYAGSEGAVEEWAYNQGHMVRPGEQMVIPISPPGTTPDPVFIPTPTVEPVQNWEIWLALILGE